MLQANSQRLVTTSVSIFLMVFTMSQQASAASSICEKLLPALHGIGQMELVESWQVQPGEPLHIVFEDWDDNLMIMHPSRIYVMNAGTGEIRGITTDEYAKHKGHMGKPGTEWEHWHFFDYLVHPDGREELITLERRNEVSAQLGRPGPFENMKLREGSWIDFRDIPNPQIFQTHVDQITLEPRGWTGPRWIEAVRRLSDAKTKARLGVITTRGHHPKAFVDAQQLMATRGLIPSVMNSQMIFPIYNAKFPQDLGAWPHERKWAVLRSMMEILRELPLHRSSDFHTLEFADDDLKTIQFLRTNLEGLQEQGQLGEVKVIIEQTNLNAWGRWEFFNPRPSTTLKSSLSLPVRVGNRQQLSAMEFNLLLDETGFSEDELLLALAHEASGIAAQSLSGTIFLGRPVAFRSEEMKFRLTPEQNLIAALAMAQEAGLQKLAFHRAPSAQAREFLLALKSGASVPVILPGQSLMMLADLLPHPPHDSQELGLHDYLNRKPQNLAPVSGDALVQEAFEFARWSYSPDRGFYMGVAVELNTGERFYGFSIDSKTHGQSISAAQMAYLEILRAGRNFSQIARVALVEVSNLPLSQKAATKHLFSVLNPGVDFQYQQTTRSLVE